MKMIIEIVVALLAVFLIMALPRFDRSLRTSLEDGE